MSEEIIGSGTSLRRKPRHVNFPLDKKSYLYKIQLVTFLLVTVSDDSP
jgi:hypothetical protein